MVAIEYCEKTLFGSFFEPINFLSNAFILISAFFMYRHLKKNNVKDKTAPWLILFAALIGIGSFSWHFYQTAPTLLLDVLPVFIFVIISIFVIINRLYQNSWIASGVIISVWLAIPLFESISIFLFQTNSNGPPFFGIVPAFIYLLAIVYFKDKEIFKKVLVPVGFFSLAIFFRQIDLIACQYIPFGTHFLWHFFNSFNIYYLFKITVEKK